MALVTCPECGSIFPDHEAHCPNCTWRVPPERVHAKPHVGVVERTSRLFRRFSNLAHLRHDAGPRVPPLKRW